MNICFLWWWDKAEDTWDSYRDGLRAAVEVIGKTHDIDVHLGEKIPDEDYEAYLIWGDSNCPAIELLKDRPGKKGIILTTDPHNIENLRKLDVVFCESTPVYEAVRRAGIRAVRAFGTDTNFFTPTCSHYSERLIKGGCSICGCSRESHKKDIPYFYPATFSPWKRQRDIAYMGKDLYCVGTVQPDGIEDLEACKEKGVNIAEGYFKVEYIRDLYRRSECVVIPAIHGSERTVLEAMACNILPEVTNDKNVRTKSYIKEYEEERKTNPKLTPREFVVVNYNPEQYAQKILRGYE